MIFPHIQDFHDGARDWAIRLCFALAFLPPGPKQDVRERNDFRSWGSE